MSLPVLPDTLRASLSAGRALIPAAIEGLGNPSWEGAGARILILRLSPWRDAARSTSHLLLFSECRKALPEAFIDFAFLPDRADRGLLEGLKAPWFFGAASGRTPAAFDLVLVSNAFTLELLNLPYISSTAGFPATARGRLADPASPLVILGGSNAAGAGAALLPPEDAWVDGLFFGEGEGAVGPLATLLADRSLPKEERLARAASIQGFWSPLWPSAGSRPARRRTLPASPPPLRSWPILNSEEASTARLQIAAGCPGLCSFCFEGWDRRPYRELPLAELLSAARDIRRDTGADSLEVYAFNFNTHAEIFSLLFELGRIFKRVSLMSQRLDILARVEGLLAAELAADKRSFTLGIEGLSRRMRAFYRKGLAEEELESLLERLVVPGVRELKLFYIIAGIEEEGDLAEFAGFMAGLAARRAGRAPGLRILVSAGYLVRLPRTPLQHAPLALEEKTIGGVARAAQAACEAQGIEFRLASHFDEYCADQVLALGGEALGPWLAESAAKGYAYDLSIPKGAWSSLHAFAQRVGLLGEAFLGEKPRGWSPPLPFLEAERDSGVLHREWEEAKAGRDRKPCLGASCSACGACADGGEIASLTGHRTLPPDADLTGRLERLTRAKAAFPGLVVEVLLPDSLVGATEEFRGAWLRRELFRRSPAAEQAVFEARAIPLGAAEAFGLPAGAVGRLPFILRGPELGALRAAAAAAGLAILDPPPAPAALRVEVVAAPRPVQPPATRPAKSSSAQEPGAQGGAFGALGEALRAHLADEHVACTETREGTGRRFTPAPRDFRKGVLLEGLVTGQGLSLRVGAKMRLDRLLERGEILAGRPLLLRVLDWES
jgi:hypothetical protein